MKRIKFNRSFALFIPLLVLLGIGVLVSTSKNVAANTTCGVTTADGSYDTAEKSAFFEGNKANMPREIADSGNGKKVLGETSSNEKWIEVDLSEQKLKAWEGNNLFLETSVSTGLPWTPTPKGEFRIWTKLRYTKMEGGQGRYYYYLPNVPFVMFFENSNIPGWRGFSLHGTYWHNSFGTQRSHGCVNLPTPIAEKIYYWVTPNLPSGKSSVRASNDNPGTRIVIHD